MILNNDVSTSWRKKSGWVLLALIGLNWVAILPGRADMLTVSNDLLSPSSSDNLGCQIINKTGHPNLLVTTFSKVIGGMPNVESPQVRASIEFALAPVNNGTPVFSQSLVVSSDQNGKFQISLYPGRYWIGPVEKVKNEDIIQPGNFYVQEQFVEIKGEGVNQLNLLRIGYAP